ncbi:MAG TPA: protein translocase subunit SecDF [Cytophagales bacterium]|nr:protein translocase subunit SecDF [Cytophagales bacterium]HAA21196.1 protein translocase subunit SecDF [Cytophagales bacterium]HAP62109.1 protein translocase subunit SecDF [Cytophagales bacterium]
MRGRGFVIFLTIIVTLLSVYFLSFTMVSRNVKEQANAYATDADGNLDYNKRQDFLDSVRYQTVYSPFGAIDYTYEDVQNVELNLGLDLQGGMSVTLEISPVEIIKALSNNSQDPTFLESLEETKNRQAASQLRFVDLFISTFNEMATDGKTLASIFANSRNRDQGITMSSADQEIQELLTREIDEAIDRSYTILETRINRFGTSQPNITLLEGTSRIQIELPGVEDQARVRKLLQGTAKLEFWEVAEINEIITELQAINTLLAEEKQAEQADSDLADALGGGDAGTAPVSDEALADMFSSTEVDTTGGDSISALEDALAGTDSAAVSDSLLATVSDLFLLNVDPQGLGYRVEDTAKINAIFARPDVQNIMPGNIQLLWDVKGRDVEFQDGSSSNIMALTAIRQGPRGEAQLAGDVINSALATFTQNGLPAVQMGMNAEGTRAWRRITTDNVGKRFAIVLDNYVYSAPVINEPIPNGISQISGSFTIDETKDLANVLEAGSLPAPVRIVEEAFVGPTLGSVARSQGINSIVAGLGIVVLFMIFYYATGGLVANIALLFNIFFIFGILAQLGSALTLPGIAGIVLTIGMSIDANVLIFERIREELRNGVNLKAAISEGYKKAFSSILDANVTTFLTAIILFVLGAGPIKGFAVTLMVGIACSFFSAIYITRVIVLWMTRKGDKSKFSFATPFSKNWLANLNIDFLSKRRIAYYFSGGFIAIGIILLSIGGLNFGVDFKGGRSYVLNFNEAVSTTGLEENLDDDFPGASLEVKTFGASNIVKITTTYLVDDESAEADEEVLQALVGGVNDYTGLTYAGPGQSMEGDKWQVASSSKVGATIADDIKRTATQSGIVAIIVIFLYILIRFERWQFSLGSIVALLHDTLVVFSAFAIAKAFGKSFEVDQVFVAAILTIIGYSINDTVVVFDRIRETLGMRSKGDTVQTFNMAINSTINRTLITSVTTLVVVLVLLIFGGEVLRGFSFALLVGILVGTYSSIFIASPVVIDFTSKKIEKKEKEKAKA